ncbi:hypothetical protein BD626DRAFT_634581 [Schizophyllum amplum]|uniref:BTB domain-containing protein n=1 Tax=Schizophyllum amplum TaxID=97359 RepID=A0A550BYV7_9AGAR|nr:hypothetical protein BD626DRAFT_634581 [Auriculariopsis ampla]
MSLSPKCHEKFSDSTPTTIAFVSCDKTTFHIERAVLERAADFMPPSSEVPSSPTEPVQLSENAATLALLFRFAYCEFNIDLDIVPFETVAALAEAADKYVVYSAMAVCRVYMKGQAKDHPVEVMQYAAKHNHCDILDVVAPYTVGTSFRTMREILPLPMLVAWAVFNDDLQQAAQAMMRVRWCPDHRRICHATDDMLIGYAEDGSEGPEPSEPCKLGDDQDAIWWDINEKIIAALRLNDVLMLASWDFPEVITDEMVRRVRRCDFCSQYIDRLKDDFARCKITCRLFTSLL